MPEQDNQKNQDLTPARVYATQQTAAYLRSIGVEPSQNPALNGKNILFAQQGDVTQGTAGRPAEGESGGDHALNYATAAVTGSSLGPNLTSSSTEYLKAERQFASGAVPELKNEGNMPAGSETPDLNNLAGANNDALKGNEPSAAHVGINGCVVALPAQDMTAQGAFAKLAGTYTGDIEKVPGSDADLSKLLTNHELGHCADPAMNGPALSATDQLTREATADNAALSQWAKEGGNPAVAEAYRDARAIAGFGDPDASTLSGVKKLLANSGGTTPTDADAAKAAADNVGDHATHSLLDDGKLNAAKVDPTDNPELAGMLRVNTMVNKAVGMAAAATGNPAVLDDIHSDMTLFSKTEGDDGQRKNNLGDAMALADAGGKIGLQNEAKNYAALNALNDRGAFREGSPEAAYADQVIGVQNKYMGGMKDSPEYKTTYDAIKNLPESGFTVKVAGGSDSRQEADSGAQAPASPDKEDNTSRPAPSYAASMQAGSLTGDDWQDKTSKSAPDAKNAFQTAAAGVPTQTNAPENEPPAPVINNRPATSAPGFG